LRLDDEETCFCSPTLNVCLCKDILTGPATPKAYYHIAALAVLGLQFSPAALHPQSQRIVSGEKMALVSFHRSLSSRTTDGAGDCRAVGLDDVAVRPALVADQLVLGRQLWLGRSVSPGSIVSQGQARYEAFDRGTGI
jgi:hypothetical protein